MHRSISITLALSLAAAAGPLFGCDNPGAEAQKKENNANATAADKTAEADKKVAEARAEADKKIAEARADFNKSREDYRHTRQGDLDTVNKKIADAEADLKTATGKKKADITANLPNVRTLRDAVVMDLKALDDATPSTWDSMRVHADHDWDSLKAAVDKI